MTPGLAARRFEIDGGVVFRDGESGKVWLLRDEVARASSGLGAGEIVAMLAELGTTTDPVETAERGESWAPPGRAPELLCLLRGDGVMLRIRIWEAGVAAVLARMLAPLVIPEPVGGWPVSTLDLFFREGRSTCVLDGRLSHDALGRSWWVLVRQLARSLNPGRRWLGVLHAATVLEEGARSS